MKTKTYLAGSETRIRAKVPDPRSTSDFTVEEIDAALATVPAFDRQVFILHRIYELTYRQIADRFGISERRVERAIANTLTRLRRALDRIGRRR